MEDGVADTEHTAVSTDQPVATAVRGDGHTDDGLFQAHGSRRPMRGGVAEGEHAAVGPDQPVAASIRSGRDAHDERARRGRAGRRRTRGTSPLASTLPSLSATRSPPPSAVAARPAGVPATVCWPDGPKAGAVPKPSTTGRDGPLNWRYQAGQDGCG